MEFTPSCYYMTYSSTMPSSGSLIKTFCHSSKNQSLAFDPNKESSNLSVSYDDIYPKLEQTIFKKIFYLVLHICIV